VPEYVLAGLAVLAAAGSVLQARRRRRGTAEGVPAESEPSGMVVG
jgi:hypothetical protein